jgi:hypothetical protein
MTQLMEISDVLKRLDAIATDIQDIKLSQVRTEERIKAIDQRFDAMDQRMGDLNP